MFSFERFMLKANKKSLRLWTLKRRFNLFKKKAKRIVKVLDLEMILVIFDEKKFGCELIFFIWFCLLLSSLTDKMKFHDTSDQLELSLTDKMKLPTISKEDKCIQNITKDL